MDGGGGESNKEIPINLSSYKMGQPRPLFVYFRSFQTQILQKKPNA